MSQSPPTALPYESISTNESVGPFWGVFRLAVILWSASVIIRHACYYAFVSITYPAGPVLILREAALAGVEVILAAVLVANAWILKPFNQRQHTTLAGLCGAFIAVSLFGFLINTVLVNVRITTLPNAMAVGADLLRLVWQLVIRLQLLIVPAMAIVVAMKWKARG